MAGTSSDREAELNRIRNSESNNTNAARSDSSSKYKEGFIKSHSPRDPNHASAGTKPPKA